MASTSISFDLIPTGTKPAAAQTAKAQSYVGKIVYKAFTPAKYGKVIRAYTKKCPNPQYHDWMFEVHWKDGSTSSICAREVNDFESLVVDHENKALKHRATLINAINTL